MPIVRTSFALILSALFAVNDCAALTVSNQLWRVHSARACNLSYHDKCEEAIQEYRVALRLARVENVSDAVIADLNLNILDLLIRLHKLDDADDMLNLLEDDVRQQGENSLFALRYCRRRVQLADAKGNAGAALGAQKRVVAIMERYFSNTSSAYLHELHVLQERLIAVNDLSSALKVDDHLAAILSHNPSRLTRSACLRWRTSFVETLEAKITSKPTSLTPFELQKIEQLLDNSSSPAHDRIPSAWCLTMVPDVKVSRSASLRIIKLVDELKEKATELEQKEAADAALSLAFRRIRRNVLDQETERFTKRAYEGWHGVLHDKQSYKDCVPLIHAGTMYSMNLARLGKLDQAERLVDSIKVPPNSVHAREELNGFVQARLEIAQMRSRQGRDDLVKLQFEKLRTLLAAQMLISQSDRDWLLRLWKKEEEKL